MIPMTIDTSYEDIRYEVLRECREKLAAMMIRLSIVTGARYRMGTGTILTICSASLRRP